MIYVLEALGYDLFSVQERIATSPAPSKQSEVSETLSLDLYATLPKRTNDRAFLRYEDGAYTLKSGSKINTKATDSLPSNVRKLREQLIADGGLIQRGEYLELSRDIPFSKPSPASALVKGRSSTGYQDWMRVSDDLHLGAILGVATSASEASEHSE